MLTKCVNICVKKFEDLQTQTLEQPEVNVVVDFNQIDQYVSNY